MNTLEDVVEDTVEGLVMDSVLFTALDVSNKVKQTLPNARHREVRDLVRGMFASHIEPQGWAKSPITVTLADGSQVEALLYHPLSASWDLDTAYDTQKRNQVSVRVAPVASVPAPATVTANGTIAVASVQKLVSTMKADGWKLTPVPAAMPTKDLWDQMFSSKPSLFPAK